LKLKKNRELSYNHY